MKRTAKRQDPIFASALSALVERYQKAISKRAELGYQLAMINAEIPALEASMQALNSQLHPQLENPSVRAALDANNGLLPPGTFDTETRVYTPAAGYAVTEGQRAIAEALPLPARTVPSNLASLALKKYGAGVAGGSLKGMGSIPASQVQRTPRGPVAVSDPLEEPIEGSELAGDLEVQEIS